jgi:hypothetical protein
MPHPLLLRIAAVIIFFLVIALLVGRRSRQR